MFTYRRPMNFRVCKAHFVILFVAEASNIFKLCDYTPFVITSIRKGCDYWVEMSSIILIVPYYNSSKFWSNAYRKRLQTVHRFACYYS
jgi:hypothetical protein